jgi:hypothetical protein
MRRPATTLGLALLLAALGPLVAACGDDGDDGAVADDAVATDGTAADAGTPSTVASATPISVGEALTQPEGSRVTILAFVLEPDEGATTLCEVLGESFPPTCGGQALTVDGLDLDGLDHVQSTSGGDLVAPVTWTDEPVPVTGTLTAGRLVVSS